MTRVGQWWERARVILISSGASEERGIFQLTARSTDTYMQSLADTATKTMPAQLGVRGGGVADCHLMFHLQPAHWSRVADGGGGAPVERKPNVSVSVHLYSLFFVPLASS